MSQAATHEKGSLRLVGNKPLPRFQENARLLKPFFPPFYKMSVVSFAFRPYSKDFKLISLIRAISFLVYQLDSFLPPRAAFSGFL